MLIKKGLWVSLGLLILFLMAGMVFYCSLPVRCLIFKNGNISPLKKQPQLQC